LCMIKCFVIMNSLIKKWLIKELKKKVVVTSLKM